MDIEKNMSLIQELARGRELMAELSSHLEGELWSDHELADDFCKGIMDAFEVVISLVKSIDIDVTVPPAESDGPPPSAEVHSPTSVLQMGHSPYESAGDPNPKNQKRRRLSSSKASSSVTDSPFGDGYQWRKYGQKMIRNVKYPRSYYKCTHTSDCNAKLMVQQIVHSGVSLIPMYEVTRNNKHTCNVTINPLSVIFQNSSSTTTTRTGSSFITFESDQSLRPSSGRRSANEEHHHFDFFPSTWQQMLNPSTAEILFIPPQSSTVPAQSLEAFWRTESDVEDTFNVSSPPLSPAGQFYDASSYL